MAGKRLCNARDDDKLLCRSGERSRSRGSVAASEACDAQAQRPAASILLGEFHSIGRMGQPLRQALNQLGLPPTERAPIRRISSTAEPPLPEPASCSPMPSAPLRHIKAGG